MKADFMQIGESLEGMSGSLQGLALEGLSRQPDFAIFTLDDSTRKRLSEVVKSLDVPVTANFVGADDDPSIESFRARPQRRLLEICSAGRSAKQHFLRLDSNEYADLSADKRVAAIHSIANENGESAT